MVVANNMDTCSRGRFDGGGLIRKGQYCARSQDGELAGQVRLVLGGPN